MTRRIDPRPLRTALVMCLVLVPLAGCNRTWRRAEPAPIPYELEPWSYGDADGQKLTTPHYEVYTTVTDPVLVKEFPELIERAYQRYQELVPSERGPGERMKVYLFATRGQWAAFTKRFTGPRAATFLKIRNGGYSERGVSVIQYVAHQTTFPLLAHEGFHQYLHHCVNPAVPAWLNEGLAVACEGQRWTGRGLKEFDAWYNPVRRNQLGEAMLRNKLFPFRELLATHAGKVVAETSTVVRTYYAQVWSLVLFLREGADGKYAENLSELCAALSSPDLDRLLRSESVWADQEVSRGEALFRRFISDDLETFEKEYNEFMRERILSAH